MATFGTFVDSETLKAAELNTFFERTLFTPVYRQAENPITLTNPYGVHFRVNKTVFCTAEAGFAGSTTQNNILTGDLPVTAASNDVRVIGVGYILTNIGDFIRLVAVKYSTTRVAFLSDSATSLTNYFADGQSPGAGMGFTIAYEAA
jgi:hypothetical protein